MITYTRIADVVWAYQAIIVSAFKTLYCFVAVRLDIVATFIQTVSLTGLCDIQERVRSTSGTNIIWADRAIFSGASQAGKSAVSMRFVIVSLRLVTVKIAFRVVMQINVCFARYADV